MSFINENKDPHRQRSSLGLSRVGLAYSDVRQAANYGVTTGQAVGPLVVHTMRPWIAGGTGLFACTQSARTWSMMCLVVARDVKTG